MRVVTLFALASGAAWLVALAALATASIKRQLSTKRRVRLVQANAVSVLLAIILGWIAAFAASGGRFWVLFAAQIVALMAAVWLTRQTYPLMAMRALAYEKAALAARQRGMLERMGVPLELINVFMDRGVVMLAMSVIYEPDEEPPTTP